MLQPRKNIQVCWFNLKLSMWNSRLKTWVILRSTRWVSPPGVNLHLGCCPLFLVKNHPPNGRNNMQQAMAKKLGPTTVGKSSERLVWDVFLLFFLVCKFFQKAEGHQKVMTLIEIQRLYPKGSTNHTDWICLKRCIFCIGVPGQICSRSVLFRLAQLVVMCKFSNWLVLAWISNDDVGVDINWLVERNIYKCCCGPFGY